MLNLSTKYRLLREKNKNIEIETDENLSLFFIDQYIYIYYFFRLTRFNCCYFFLVVS